jgi:hypothetical protein
VQAELLDGETVQWAAKPIVRRLLKAALFDLRSRRTGWIVWAFLALVALSVIQLLPLLFSYGIDGLTLWFTAIPLLLLTAAVAAGIGYRIYRLRRAYESVVYVVTNQRLLTGQSWPQTIVLSEPLETLLREPSAKYVNGDGSGSIIFSGKKGISGVPDVQALAAVLERLKAEIAAQHATASGPGE